jgi:uncharacterized RDD family membrane protein YckC
METPGPAAETLSSATEPLRPASKGKRFVNLIVDMIGYYAFLIAIMIFIGITAPNFMQRWEAGKGLAFATNVVVFFLYYLVCEGMTMSSPGKLLTRTKVVSEDGGVPTLGQIALRTLIRHVPFEWLPIFGGNGDAAAGVPLHDKWSRTVVISIAKNAESL